MTGEQGRHTQYIPAVGYARGEIAAHRFEGAEVDIDNGFPGATHLKKSLFVKGLEAGKRIRVTGQIGTQGEALLDQIRALALLRELQIPVQAQVLDLLIAGVLRALISIAALPAASPGQIKVIGEKD